MRWEYALFDLAILLPPLLLGRRFAGWTGSTWRAVVWACSIGALPFIMWDALVVGRHWHFSSPHVLGPTLLGLPIEEWGFFVAVPLACTMLWESVFAGMRGPALARARWIYGAAGLAVVPALWALAAGLEYTALALFGLAIAAALDHALGTRVLQLRRGLYFLAAVAGLTTIFNGYLTARPIVIYDPRYQLGVLIGTIPVEDYGFGLALALTVTVLYQHARRRVVADSWLALAIRARFGGYRHLLVAADRQRPARVDRTVRVAVVGGGLAGLAAAELLSARGFAVTLIERNRQLGGKLAAWRERLPDGFDASIEHGFHAFFRQYYNLRAWLGVLGIESKLRPIDDYAIIARDGRRFSFAGTSTTPGLNLLGLARLGFFRVRDVMRPRTGRALEALLRYDAAVDDAEADHTSYAEFVERAGLPAELRTVFTTFARAFFADERKLSMAELIKAFHFYYLGHDRGLIYDYLDGAYDDALIDPIASLLRGRGVEIQLDTVVRELAPHDGGIAVDGTRFDHVVLAADVAAARAIILASPALAGTRLAKQIEMMHAGQRYAVVRLWCRQHFGDELPLFVVTERRTTLDAIAFVHRTDPTARAWANEHGGSVLELHCYAVPDALEHAAIETSLLDDAAAHFPALREAVVHGHVQVRDDFTALHVDMRANRPTVETDVPNLVLAGDWVRLSCPAMLMEAAHTSACLAINAICAQHQVCGVPVWTVPLTGLLPARDRNHRSTSSRAGWRELGGADARGRT